MSERKRRGFASMSDERQREIASMGGRAAHAQGRAHEFTPDEARAAGKKGGQAVRDKYGPEFYASIGRIGGGKRGRGRQHATGETTATEFRAARTTHDDRSAVASS